MAASPLSLMRHKKRVSFTRPDLLIRQPLDWVGKRMVKKQQMHWSEAGVHKILQVRTKALNDELRETFARWYPGTRTDQEPKIEKKAA
jgi:hypothetical protein